MVDRDAGHDFFAKALEVTIAPVVAYVITSVEAHNLKASGTHCDLFRKSEVFSWGLVHCRIDIKGKGDRRELTRIDRSGAIAIVLGNGQLLHSSLV
ncbi:hypothetical protein VN97_g12448 [Penicillium thymicola]|uniref:Uncharacterized protein n=1 Tax=Penicillium thymicola TaxID=293382 RepID=A0AAI9T5Z3_PENTH|nr:hypothetical protein VN97_g12448 [Penicillium thymicola]